MQPQQIPLNKFPTPQRHPSTSAGKLTTETSARISRPRRPPGRLPPPPNLRPPLRPPRPQPHHTPRRAADPRRSRGSPLEARVAHAGNTPRAPPAQEVLSEETSPCAEEARPRRAGRGRAAAEGKIPVRRRGAALTGGLGEPGTLSIVHRIHLSFQPFCFTFSDFGVGLEAKFHLFSIFLFHSVSFRLDAVVYFVPRR